MSIIKLRGIVFALVAASLWAISGISAQILFNQYDFSAGWVVTCRLLMAGILLLGLAKFCNKEKILAPFKNKRDIFSLLAFSVLGMYLVQFTYFKTVELSNASFSTIIQYTGPLFVVLYESARRKKIPSKKTLLLLVTTLLGMVLVATKGEVQNLLVPGSAVFFGLLSALALAFYSVQPRRLLQKYGSLLIVGWGMLLAGFVSNLIHPLWQNQGVFTKISLLQLATIVIFGTAVAFVVYLTSLKYITSSLASILTAFEPILATVVSVMIFQFSLGWVGTLGFISVLVSIGFLQKEL